MVRAKIGMSISAAISAAPTKKLTSMRAPGRRTAQRAARHQRRLGPAQVQHEGDRRDRGAEEVPAGPGRRRPATSRVRGGEGQDHAGRARAPAAAPRPGRPRAGVRDPAAQVDQRPGGGAAADHEQHARRPSPTTPSGVSQRPSPANGMNSRPQVRSRSSGGGWTNTSAAGDQGDAAGSDQPDPGRGDAVAGGSGDAPRHGAAEAAGSRPPAPAPTARLISEDRPPVGDRQHQGAEQRADDAAELLHRRDDAERDAAPVGGVEVGDQGQRRRHQPAAADALEEPAGDHAGQVVGERGDQRADREHDQRPRPAPAPGRAGRRSGRSAAASRRTRAGSPRRSAPPAGAASIGMPTLAIMSGSASTTT